MVFLEDIEHKLTRLNWFEEWLFFFEMNWGHTITRWEDTDRIYKARHPKNIFDSKLYYYLIVRKHGQNFFRLTRIRSFEKEKWNENYEDMRVLLWYMTDIGFNFKNSTELNQIITCYTYYRDKCTKGGVGDQLSGWIRTDPI